MTSLNASAPGGSKPISIWRLGAYSVLQLPLAMAALPVILNVSHFYGGTLALHLGTLGIIFFATRLIDALQDPVIGYYSDRLTHRRNGRLLMVMAAVPILGLGFFGLFSPPDWESGWLLVWLAATLFISHLGYSGVSISYHSLGAELSKDYHERTRITVGREVFGILGMLLAAALPTLLVKRYGDIPGYAMLAMIFIPILAIPALITWLGTPQPVTGPVIRKQHGSLFRSFAAPIRHARFRYLAAVFLVNGTAVAIAASVVLFYIDDVIRRSDWTPWFLLAYFMSGAASVPLWLWLSRRTSKAAAWLVGVAVSAIGLVGAAFLGEGDAWLFLFVCVFSGIGLGADYGIPPSILADVIHNEEKSESRGETGAYFGIWALATKLTTALAAAVALPLLQWLGYVPHGSDPAGIKGLVIVYVLLPVVVKTVAGLMLWHVQIEVDRPAAGRVLRGERKLARSPVQSERT